VDKVVRKTRKVRVDSYGYFIVVDKEKYYLKNTVIEKESIGNFITIDNIKYYLQRDNKQEIKVLVFDGVKFKEKIITQDIREIEGLLKGKFKAPKYNTRIDKAGIFMAVSSENITSKKKTLLLMSSQGKIKNTIYGDIVFHRMYEDGTLKGLNDMDIKYIKKQIHITLERDEATGDLLCSLLVR